MLFLEPYIISDVGFQLSFLATLGILLIKPLLPLPKKNIVSEDFGTTVAAQVSTLPVLLGTFGMFGILSIIVNVLILWTVPVLMLFGSIGLLTGLLFEPVGKLILYFCLPFLIYFEYIVSLFGGVGWILEIKQFPWQFTLGYYLLLLAFVLRKKPGNQTPQKLELGL
jgi:competence protein ComEC